MDKIATPGSALALSQGCTCPVYDNAHGRGSGYGPHAFWISDDCPLHGKQGADMPEEVDKS